MFCPVCRSEYRPGFARCIDCDVGLVDRLPEPAGAESKPDPAAPRIVFVTSSSSEAALVKSLLEANGLEVWPLDDNLSRIHSFYSAAIGGIKLAVTPREEELARTVLEAYRGAAGESPTLGRMTPFDLTEAASSPKEQDENGRPPELECPWCGAPSAPDTTICSQCGFERERLGEEGPDVDRTE